MPGFADPHCADFARANTSIGINETVLNNVNVSADILKPEFPGEIATLAGVFCPWGIRVYVSHGFRHRSRSGG
nr:MULTISPECIES: hypothetical protein [unclassified Sphingomonas]